jgi:protein-glutamine gamma-glutamyltransferase
MTVGSKSDRLQQLLIRLAVVVLPTIVIGYITLRFLNFSYTSLTTGLFSQTIYFSFGLVAAYVLYYYGARWVVTFFLLWVAYWLFDKAINRLPGEFDVFYTTARFQLYSTLFIFGWVFGLLLVRIKWAYIILFAVLSMVTLVSISDTIDLSLSYILIHIFPVTAYGLYMYFLSPLLAERIELDKKKSVKFLLRVVLFVVLVMLAFVIAESLLKGNVKAVEKELAARGAKGDKDGSQKDKDNYDDRDGLMDKTDDGYRLKDTMRVTSKMSQSDKLMFCSKLDNYFPDGSPAPIYFVYHYLTRYDPIKETFTRDINVPSLDEITVDPTALPMYYSYTDTSMIRKSMASKLRKVVEAQVYLSENTWKHSVLGPASVFSIQTIPVEKDFQKTFIQGYKIASFTSELNNAYFVYNISASPTLEPLQEQRHDELRSVRSYEKLNQEFFDYYTKIPTGGIYDSISKLALNLTSKASKPVDKVIAVRDFFLKRNENGKRIFRYTLKAGAVDDPNIPSSKMLYNFLFKTHAGYCTYYAGASLFMLRALGVPTRFTTGFATINRSDKNKGWYWFYASQAHAWTQVYFPGYGWLDFDMTIGNEDQQSAPKPDGTPPLPPPEPWLVINGKAETVNTSSKSLTVSFDQLIYFNTPHQMSRSFTRPVDASLCRVLYDKRDTTFAAIQPGDSMIIVSYKDEAKKIPTPRAGVSIENQVNDFPSPIIADEIHIRVKEKDKKKEGAGKKAKPAAEKRMTWQEIIWLAGKILIGLLIFVFLLPVLYLLYCLLRISISGNAITKANQVYRAALYRFHMAGLEREDETPLEYAQHKVDPTLSAGFEEFMRVYLRLKYANGNLRDGDVEAINSFANNIGPSIRKKMGIPKMILNYLNVLRASRYIQPTPKADYENQLL